MKWGVDVRILRLGSWLWMWTMVKDSAVGRGSGAAVARSRSVGGEGCGGFLAEEL